ncbi:hypothetical protein HDU67_005728 [Dinochytrium kinnereticum]|nr:hypothetical protein HDU67_005728 [Dinochytrium kinnereticum]
MSVGISIAEKLQEPKKGQIDIDIDEVPCFPVTVNRANKASEEESVDLGREKEEPKVLAPALLRDHEEDRPRLSVENGSGIQLAITIETKNSSKFTTAPLSLQTAYLAQVRDQDLFMQALNSITSNDMNF